MRTFLLLAFALASCIDGTRDGFSISDSSSVDTRADVSDIADDTRDASEVDTGGLTCGKCVQVWHAETVATPNGVYSCARNNQTGEICCPTQGDTGCPEALHEYEWRVCADVREAFGVVYCADSNAYVDGHKTSERGALCAEENFGCGTLPRQN